MPRAGGESDKLGGRYEGAWTVDSVLDVVVGRLGSICVEPLSDNRGVEFLTTANAGLPFFHSVKRQHSDGDWSLYELTKRTVKLNGRSTLGDLTDRLRTSQKHHAV